MWRPKGCGMSAFRRSPPSASRPSTRGEIRMAMQRQVIMPAGRKRVNSPVPESMRMGGWLFTSLLGPTSQSGGGADDPVGDARLLFNRIQEILDAAGARPENIAQLRVYVLDDDDRQAINVAWGEMYPDP